MKLFFKLRKTWKSGGYMTNRENLYTEFLCIRIVHQRYMGFSDRIINLKSSRNFYLLRIKKNNNKNNNGIFKEVFDPWASKRKKIYTYLCIVCLDSQYLASYRPNTCRTCFRFCKNYRNFLFLLLVAVVAILCEDNGRFPCFLRFHSSAQ